MKNPCHDIVDGTRMSCYISSMNNIVKDALADSIRGFRLPRYREIPDVGLYLEQAATYINQIIAPLGFGIFTGSMIRNYVKQRLVSSPINKQYSANQIAHLMVIAILKQAVPLEHINSLFSLQQKVYADQTAYDYFCDELENILYHRFGLKDTYEDIGVTDSLEKEMLRSAIIAVSHIVYLNTCLTTAARLNKTSEQPLAPKPNS